MIEIMADDAHHSRMTSVAAMDNSLSLRKGGKNRDYLIDATGFNAMTSLEISPVPIQQCLRGGVAFENQAPTPTPATCPRSIFSFVEHNNEGMSSELPIDFSNPVVRDYMSLVRYCFNQSHRSEHTH